VIINTLVMSTDLFEPRHFTVLELAEKFHDLTLHTNDGTRKRPYSLSTLSCIFLDFETMAFSYVIVLLCTGWKLSSHGAKGLSLFKFKN
jgi:hypothetical protein